MTAESGGAGSGAPASMRSGWRAGLLGAAVMLVLTVVLSGLLLTVGAGFASILIGAVAALFVTRPIAEAIGATLDERRRAAADPVQPPRP